MKTFAEKNLKVFTDFEAPPTLVLYLDNPYSWVVLQNPWKL